MTAALSDSALMPLQALTTRDASDWTLALLDSWAVTLDVLTFYQERLANEAYLRTAVQGRSIFELARLVGYVPSPGVSASTVLAFTLNSAQGAPQTVQIPGGTRAQSVPPAGSLPQVFETSSEIQANIAWNALPAQTFVEWQLNGGDTETRLNGTSTGLQRGDVLLFVTASDGIPNANGPADIRTVTSVQTVNADNVTDVHWDRALVSFSAGTTADKVTIFAMRKKAALFGAQAPNPFLFSNVAGITGSTGYPGANETDWQFQYTASSSEVYLDTAYSGIAPSNGAASWAVMVDRSHSALFQISSLRDISPNLYTLTGKSTALMFSSGVVMEGSSASSLDDLLTEFVQSSRTATVYAGSEQLQPASLPLRSPYISDSVLPSYPLLAGMLLPVYGNSLNVVGGQGIAEGSPIGVQGKLVRIRVTAALGVSFVPDGTSDAMNVAVNQVFILGAYPPVSQGKSDFWIVRTLSGVAGTLQVSAGTIQIEPADAADDVMSEAARVKTVTVSGDVTQLQLAASLACMYDASTVQVNANAVDATNGETVQEILGSGDGTNPALIFTLKQSPLTYVSAATAGGAASTLQIWVNNQRWNEVPNFLTSGNADRVFVTGQDENGSTFVQFGDGVRGARTPTGQSNIRAVYRKGIGVAGMVSAGQISQLLDRPQGLKGVMNPGAATGAADPASPQEARSSAPLPTLTLGRVVSLEDYQAYASAFPGIGKALASWMWVLQERTLLLTVAGTNGSVLVADDPVVLHLMDDLRTYGTGRVAVRIVPYDPVLFRVSASLLVDTSEYAFADIAGNAWAALQTAFAFSQRSFGQGVAVSEVVEQIQNCAGVAAVQLQGLNVSGTQKSVPASGLLRAQGAYSDAGGVVHGAQLLMLDPASQSGLGACQ